MDNYSAALQFQNVWTTLPLTVMSVQEELFHICDTCGRTQTGRCAKDDERTSCEDDDCKGTNPPNNDYSMMRLGLMFTARTMINGQEVEMKVSQSKNMAKDIQQQQLLFGDAYLQPTKEQPDDDTIEQV